MNSKSNLISKIQFPIETMQVKLTEEGDLRYVIEAEKQAYRFVAQWSEETHRQAISDGDRLHLTVTSSGEQQAYFIISGLNNKSKSLELTRLVVTAPGKGIGTGVLTFVKQLCFEILTMHRLWLDVIDYNHRAIELYKRAGFVHEGTLREVDFFEDSYHSSHIFSILEQEYAK